MKKTLSPYYIVVPLISPLTGATALEYTLELRVWDGLKSAAPALPTYARTVKNTSSSTGSHKINVSRLINDFIEFTPQDNGSTALINGNNQRWVQTSVVYTTSNPTDDDVQQEILRTIVVKGYAYGNEGENTSTPTNKNLISGTEFNVSRTGVFVLPIEIDETVEQTGSITLDSVNFNSATTVEADVDLSYTITGFSPGTVTIQTSEFGLDIWTDLETRSNFSPLLNVIVTYPVGGSTDVRIVFVDNLDLYVSNSLNIGLV